MLRSIARKGPLALALVLAGCGLTRCNGPQPLDAAAFDALYATPLPAPEGPLSVYHLGHSLVGRDMPAMLAQLVEGHRYDSQLGWGTPLKTHWEPDIPIPGFDTENAHPRHRPAGPALDSGDYDAVVLTEMVEIRDAIRWHDSPEYLHRWAARARAGNPAARVYLYETWHRLDDPDGWLERIEADLPGQWEAILRGAMAREARPIHLIPAGQVMARLVRRIEAGEIPGLTRREDLFGREPDGAQDMIHLNDLGAYVVALTHYAVLYHASPIGLLHRLLRADGSPADPVPDAAAAAIQQTVWEVVSRLPRTGISQPQEP